MDHKLSAIVIHARMLEPLLPCCGSSPTLSRKGILFVLSDGVEGLLGVLQVFLGDVRLGEALFKLRVVDDYGERALRLQPHLQHHHGSSNRISTVNAPMYGLNLRKSEAFPLAITSTGLPAYCDTGYCDKMLIVTLFSSQIMSTTLLNYRLL